MTVNQKEADQLFELGKLYFDRGDFTDAREKLTEAATLFYQAQNFSQYLDCQNKLLRMCAEREDHEEINRTKENLQDLVLKEGFELTSQTYYTLGICATYKAQYDVAQEYFQKSLAIALAHDDKASICYAINGIAIVYYNQDQLSEALKEIYNLKVFFQVLELPALKLSNHILNGHILRKLGRHDEALEIFWECYDMLREEKNLSMYVSLLFGMGITYQDMGETELARMYLQLAQRTTDPDNLKWMSRQVDKKLQEVGVRPYRDYDLIFDPSNNSVTERKKGKVNFKNQFILLDLLHLFMKNPGRVFSKEELVRKIWKQDYNPAVHDNKIYVTIKRLRKMIEPDYEKPRYVFRAKNGYYLNKSTRILLEQ